MLSCGCVIGSRCHRHTLMVANLRQRFGDDKYTRVSHAPVDEGNETMNDQEKQGASAQGDGDGSVNEAQQAQEPQTTEAPAANDATGESDEAPAQTN